MEKRSKTTGRRKFIGDAAALGLLGAVGGSLGMSGGGLLLSSCSHRGQRYEMPIMPEIAPDGPLLKAGLIGCGGRGTGAAGNFLNAGPNLQITALADVFPERVERTREFLKERHDNDVPEENCFVGFDAYQRVIDSGVDLILEASASYYRPKHFEAAVRARKHAFIEKPAGVDPVGARRVMASGRMAGAAGLSVVAGTQYRHQHDYVKTHNMVKNGAIGELISANAWYNRGGTSFVSRQPGWCDMEAMLRNRANWIWLTGDAPVNLVIHQTDIIHWFFDKYPVRAIGSGGRHHRQTGDMWDFFSMDFIFDDQKTYHATTREIDGCTNNINVFIYGTKGYTNCQNRIWDYDGNVTWEYEYPLDGQGNRMTGVPVSPYDQEIINFITAIRTNNPVNEAETLASSTIAGIMGRESAYTGRDVTWEDMMNSDMDLGPKEHRFGPLPDFNPVPPVPGRS